MTPLFLSKITVLKFTFLYAILATDTGVFGSGKLIILKLKSCIRFEQATLWLQLRALPKFPDVKQRWLKVHRTLSSYRVVIVGKLGVASEITETSCL